MLANRQTDKQASEQANILTDTLIAILHTPTGRNNDMSLHTV